MKPFFISVDFGSLTDYSAIQIIERILFQHRDPRGIPNHLNQTPTYQSKYALRYTHRFPLNVKYETVLERVYDLQQSPQLLNKNHLIVDSTSSVYTVQTMQSRGMNPIGIWYSHGNMAKKHLLGYTVPKEELINTLNMVFQSRRMEIPAENPYLQQILKEFEHFVSKRTEHGNMTYEAAKESIHDDLVVSLAQAVWYAEKMYGRVQKIGKRCNSARKMPDPLRHGLD